MSAALFRLRFAVVSRRRLRSNVGYVTAIAGGLIIGASGLGPVALLGAALWAAGAWLAGWWAVPRTHDAYFRRRGRVWYRTWTRGEKLRAAARAQQAAALERLRELGPPPAHTAEHDALLAALAALTADETDCMAERGPRAAALEAAVAAYRAAATDSRERREVAERLAADEERTRQESVRLSAAWARAMGTGWVPAVAEREHERLVAEVASYADAVAGFADACAAGDAATARHLGEALDALGERVHAAASALRDTLGVTGRWPLTVEGRQSPG